MKLCVIKDEYDECKVKIELFEIAVARCRKIASPGKLITIVSPSEYKIFKGNK